MARVLLVGQGPAGGAGFPQLRAAHFRAELEGAGHAVRTVLLGDRSRGAPSGWAGALALTERGPGWIEALRALAAGAEVLVSAGPYQPALGACLVAGERPVWADVPGDPMAELQAVSLVSEVAVQRRAAARAAWLPVLARADAFSTISERQRCALLGALGAVDRLADGVADERAWTMPVAWRFPGVPRPPRPRGPGEPLVLALGGSFNTWLDADTLREGVDRAMARWPEVSLVVTGGPVDGLPDAGWRRWRRWAEGHPRVRTRLRASYEDAADTIATAHLGLCLDRPGVEPLLGSRTRLLWYAWLGLDLLTSTDTELGAALVEAGAATGVATGDPDALVERIGVALGSSTRGTAARWLSARFAPDDVARPLLDWVAHPRRRAPAPPDALAADHARLVAELAAIHASPTWRTLSRLHRALRRWDPRSWRRTNR